jgi:CPA1 family monovalent cation:H+ antiporter
VLFVLIIVSIVAVIVRIIKLPYTLALIFTGLFLTIFKLPFTITLAEDFPGLLLAIFLPALLFDGAMNTKVDKLMENITTVTFLAVFGVISSVLISGALIHYFLGLSWLVSLLFGALISPTDPIAVLKIFKTFGVSERLSSIVEAEALFNDGTGLVVFKIIVALITSGVISFGNIIIQFFQLAVGGLFVGLFIGYIASKIIRKINDRMVQISLTSIVAYGGYLLAEHFGLSGVITVVASGLVIGAYGMKYIHASSKISIYSFWEYISFLLNSVVFLLIGVEIQITDLIGNLGVIFIAFFIVLGARAISVMLISFIINNFDNSKIINNINESIPYKWVPVIVWGGLHGGLSMVLVLTLSPALGIDKTFLLNLTFGVVFLSLVLQASSMRAVLHLFGLSQKTAKSKEYQELVARILANSAAETEIKRLYKSKLISKKIYDELKKEVITKLETSERDLEKTLANNPELRNEQLKEAENACLIAKRGAILEGWKEGLYSEEIADMLISEIDEILMK